MTHKFSIAGHEGYVTVGLYDNGAPGEIFVRMAKEGSVIAGLMDSFATAISLALQHGVPLGILCEKFRGTRFEPAGFTGNAEIPIATSIMDYLFRWLALRFVGAEAHPRPVRTSSTCRMSRCSRISSRAARSSSKPTPPWRFRPRNGCAALPRVRHADGALRRLSQVPQLRQHLRLLVKTSALRFRARARVLPPRLSPLVVAASPFCNRQPPFPGLSISGTLLHFSLSRFRAGQASELGHLAPITGR